jgi:hypothetical protein
MRVGETKNLRIPWGFLKDKEQLKSRFLDFRYRFNTSIYWHGLLHLNTADSRSHPRPAGALSMLLCRSDDNNSNHGNNTNHNSNENDQSTEFSSFKECSH